MISPLADRDRHDARALAMGAALRSFRARRGWSVEAAAIQAGMSHMAWRRIEDSHTVRAATLVKVETLLDLPFGSLRRALGDDTAMVDVLIALDVGLAPDGRSPAELVDGFARQMFDQRDVKPAVRARLASAVEPAAAPVQDDLSLALRLIERLARRPQTPAVVSASQALLVVVPELVPSGRAPAGDDG
jgi:transcriptional regulator with XRE-family HTH domain